MSKSFIPLPEWQLPPGVSRGLWDYVHDAELARSYDAALAGSPLLATDVRFCEEQFPAPGRLIDLGCGTGRLLLAFARRGFWTLGVDLSAGMLRVAGAKAEAERVTIQRLRANVVELEGLRDGVFDYAACLFSTLGMVTGAAERQRALAHVYRSLRPGGRFVLHVHNRWFNAWDRAGRRWLARNVLSSLLGKANAGDRAMPVHQGIAGLALHLFTRHEALRLLRDAGFRVREVRPISIRGEGILAWPWWFGWLRAYGYLIAAERR
jgi:SAM-dependent methyltransferase